MTRAQKALISFWNANEKVSEQSWGGCAAENIPGSHISGRFPPSAQSSVIQQKAADGYSCCIMIVGGGGLALLAVISKLNMSESEAMRHQEGIKRDIKDRFTTAQTRSPAKENRRLKVEPYIRWLAGMS